MIIITLQIIKALMSLSHILGKKITINNPLLIRLYLQKPALNKLAK
jgi:hypothetical protein